MASKLCLLLTAVICLAALSDNVDATCPEARSILPCYCSDFQLDTAYTTIICYGNPNFEKVKAKLISTVTTEVHLYMTKVQQSTFDKVSLSGLKVSSFYLTSSNVSKVAASVFLGQENSLKTVNFINTPLDRIPVTALSKLRNLQELRFRESKVTKIVKEDIDKLPSGIRTIGFENNKISSIDNGSFTKLSSLQNLRLSDSSLESLPNGLIGPSVSLLDLSVNNFTQVPTAAWTILTDTYVTLYDNQITSVPSESVMKPLLEARNNFILYKNPLECKCDMKWIPQYMAAHKEQRIYNIQGSCVGDSHRKSKNVDSLKSSDFKDCQ